MRTNRLNTEKSPYLLQHAHNPVDWYPWSDEAFTAARRDDKPVFLSIGYSTCHWCHVMERESFEDPQVAELLNAAFICIKVDREERPDIDELYMAACQAMSGSGGWPLTVILTPDKKPFFAGTYFPREGRFGRPGLLELIPRLADLWKNRRADVLRSGDQIMQSLGASASQMASSGELLDSGTLDAAFQELSANFDPRHGGFGSAPKFPTPHNLNFLLRYWKHAGSAESLYMVETTLQAMQNGGIRDHLGGGFHRYSTDERWLVPHFEKMLYDQALLAIAYLETGQATGKSLYLDTARQIFAYVLRDLTNLQGGFYCGEDADSEGEEGKFYLWTQDEIANVLGHNLSEIFTLAYNLAPDGNFTDPQTGRKSGENILHLTRSIADLAAQLEISEADLTAQLKAAQSLLFAARQKRVRPALDDKVLTDWNGLMIAALALGTRLCGDQTYAKAASRAADFILSNLRREDGRLQHRWRDGQAAISAGLDDYVFLIWGLLELYETNFEVKRLEQALELSHLMVDHFWDETRGGFFLAADDTLDLPVKRKEIYDGALPSGNSVAALDLLRLGRITGDTSLETKAKDLFSAFAPTVSRYPAGYTCLLSALDIFIGPSCEITLAGSPESADLQTMIQAVQARFLPRKILLLRSDDTAADLARLAPYTQGQASLNHRATAYVCRDSACRLPVTDLSEFKAILDELEREEIR
jgi:uncharacterized protein